MSDATQDTAAHFAKTAQVASEQTKQQLEALMQAGNVLAKGAEEVSREFSAYVQSSMTGAADITKAMMSTYTLKDLVSLQSDYMKASFESLVTNSSRISEIGVRVANEAWSPLAARMQQNVDRMMRPADLTPQRRSKRRGRLHGPPENEPGRSLLPGFFRS